MSDNCFTAGLSSQNLLPKDLNEQVKSLTHARKAEHFLDNMIKPAVAIGDISGFMKPLELMEKSQYIPAKRLVNQIRLNIQESATLHEIDQVVCLV